MRVLAALLLPVAVLLPVAYVGHRLNSDVPPSPARPSAIVSSDRVFVTPAQFDRWLRSRGGSYKAWARRHPEAAGRARGEAAASTAVQVSQAAGTRASGDSHTPLLIGGLLALGCGFVLALSRLPRRAPALAVIRRRRPRPLRVSQRGAALSRDAGRMAANGVVSARDAGAQAAFTLAHFRRQHPELMWYVATCFPAAALGVLIPYSLG